MDTPSVRSDYGLGTDLVGCLANGEGYAVASAMAHDLVRIDPDRNVHRLYRLDSGSGAGAGMQPDLFGQVSLIRECSRIGQDRTVRIATFPAEDEANTEVPRSGPQTAAGLSSSLMTAFGGT